MRTQQSTTRFRDFYHYKSCVVQISKIITKKTRLRDFSHYKSSVKSKQILAQDHGQAVDLGDNFYTLKLKGRQSKNTDVRIHKTKVKTV
jgi:hypothetical protein